MAAESNKLYRTIWRWHFYAGLFCIPFVITLSVTGAIYLFKPQIENWTDRDYLNLDINGDRALPSDHIRAAKEHFGAAIFINYRVPKNDNEAVVITVKHEAKKYLVYVHPNTSGVLKAVASDRQFTRVIRTFHGELLLGNVGAILIELAGCWAIVLIITGLYLWWPRGSSGIAGVLYPRINQGGRKFWRDLHVVTGFWVALFTLFLLITGLPWALVWGTAFKEIRSLGAPPVSQGWSISRATQSHSLDDGQYILSLDILRKAQALKFAPPVILAPDKNTSGVWTLSSTHQNRTLRASARLNADGELLELVPFADKPTVDRVIGVGIAAHEGHLFGWLNQLLGLLVALGLILVSASGFILWRQRKPVVSLGAPKVLPSNRTSKLVFYISITLSLLLPVIALSLLAMLVIEKAILKYFPRVRLWLGIEV